MNRLIVWAALRQQMSLDTRIENPECDFENISGKNKLAACMTESSMILWNEPPVLFKLLISQRYMRPVL